MASRLVFGLGKTQTHPAQAQDFHALAREPAAQFHDCCDNQHKSEALVTNKPSTLYMSTLRLIEAALV